MCVQNQVHIKQKKKFDFRLVQKHFMCWTMMVILVAGMKWVWSENKDKKGNKYQAKNYQFYFFPCALEHSVSLKTNSNASIFLPPKGEREVHLNNKKNGKSKKMQLTEGSPH